MVNMDRRSRKIPRCALHMPTESAGAKLYASRNDQAMITASGLNLTAFNDLHHSFKTLTVSPPFSFFFQWGIRTDGIF